MKVTVRDVFGVLYDREAELTGVDGDGMVRYVVDAPFPVTQFMEATADVLPARSLLEIRFRAEP